MIKVFNISLLFLLLSSIYIFSKPGIKIIPGELNFGKISKDRSQNTNGDDVVRKKLKIKNVGNEKLIIDKIHTSCGCTAVLISKKNLEPGEESEVDVAFKYGNYDGEVTRMIGIHSNDPENPVKKVLIKAFVYSSFTCEPYYINFYNLDINKSETVYTILESDFKKELNIGEMVYDKKYFDISCKKKGFNKWELRVKFKKQKEPVRSKSKLIIKFKDSDISFIKEISFYVFNKKG